MKTTVDIPEKLLQDAMRHTKAKTKREAILTALRELASRRSMADLVKFSGTAKDLMSVEELAQLRATDCPLPATRRRAK
jgi:Arc/MetJ family transcription regulator